MTELASTEVRLEPTRASLRCSTGGRVVHDGEMPEWWTIADPEGNEVDIAVAFGREERWAVARRSAGA